MANPNDVHHAKLEADVVGYLEDRDILHDDLTYHSKMDPSMARIISQSNTPTSQTIRTRPDRIAQHRKILDVNFFLEFKTRSTGEPSFAQDMFFEAWPYMFHWLEGVAGTRCLYVCRDVREGAERDWGFWTSDFTPTLIHIPVGQSEWYETVFREVWPEASLLPVNVGRFGSGDPYVVLQKPESEDMRDWRDLIDEEIGEHLRTDKRDYG